jgi:peptidoglycan lytic transglycosylase D
MMKKEGRNLVRLGASLFLLGLLVGSPATAEEPGSESVGDSSLSLCQPEETAFPDPYPFTAMAPPPTEVLNGDSPLGDSPLVQPGSDSPPEAVAPLLSASVSPATPIAPFQVTFNEWVQYFLEFFQAPRRREITRTWLNRSGRYLDMIQDVFQRYRLPRELAYVAMIESGFNPTAVSRAGAKGLWQFMEHTARRYGLRVDRWVDERLDPEKSTVAAAMYLRDLFDQFGSWSLAKAAYNAGELKVALALQRSGSSDFWVLRRGRVLRDETKRYVPAIMAATVIALNPEQYGFEVLPEPRLAYDAVPVPALVDLKTLAARSGIALDDLRRLNPELRRGTTPPGEPYPVKVPSGSGNSVGVALEAMRPSRGQRPVHVVKAGETLAAIAKHHGVAVSDLAGWNGLSRPYRVLPGSRLVVSASQ